MALLEPCRVGAVLDVVVLPDAVSVVPDRRLASNEVGIPFRLFNRHSCGLHARACPIDVYLRVEVRSDCLEIRVARFRVPVANYAVRPPVERRAELHLEVGIVLLYLTIYPRQILHIEVGRSSGGLKVRRMHREPMVVEMERKAHANGRQKTRPPRMELVRSR